MEMTMENSAVDYAIRNLTDDEIDAVSGADKKCYAVPLDSAIRVAVMGFVDTVKLIWGIPKDPWE
jgi:hypothetical protein